jgi:hypothetical protein
MKHRSKLEDKIHSSPKQNHGIKEFKRERDPMSKVHNITLTNHSKPREEIS